MSSIIDRIKQGKILVSDGAWGTFLHKRGLGSGECPELWNITHRQDVFGIAMSYIDAGSDIILTNSFGGSPAKLQHYGLEDRTFELNEAAAVISREAAGQDHLVMGSIGPTGVMLMMGMVTPNVLLDGFKIQAEALQKGGVDVICVETMSAVDEAMLAIQAAKEVTDLEVVCTFTFEKTVTGEFRSMMGVSPTEMLQAVKEAGVSVIGTNCGNGFEQMIHIVEEFRKVDTEIPILVHANAGKPSYDDGKTVFPETPDMMAAHVDALVAAGANIIGGCCGSTPEHIQAIVSKIRS